MRNRLAGIAILLIGTLALSSCAAGFGAQTQQQKASGNGRFDDTGDLKIRGLSIVFNPNNPTVGSLLVTIHNAGKESDSLTGIYETDGKDGLAVESNPNQLANPITIAPQQTISIGYHSDIFIPFVPYSDFFTGSSLPVTLVFEKAPLTTFAHVLVNENSGDFADVSIPQSAN